MSDGTSVPWSGKPTDPVMMAQMMAAPLAPAVADALELADLWSLLEAADPRVRQELLNAWAVRDSALAAVSRVRERAEETWNYDSVSDFAEAILRALDGDE